MLSFCRVVVTVSIRVNVDQGLIVTFGFGDGVGDGVGECIVSFRIVVSDRVGHRCAQ